MRSFVIQKATKYLTYTRHNKIYILKIHHSRMHFVLRNIELKWAIVTDTTSHNNPDNARSITMFFWCFSLWLTNHMRGTDQSSDVHSSGSPPTKWQCTQGVSPPR